MSEYIRSVNPVHLVRHLPTAGAPASWLDRDGLRTWFATEVEPGITADALPPAGDVTHTRLTPIGLCRTRPEHLAAVVDVDGEGGLHRIEGRAQVDDLAVGHFQAHGTNGSSSSTRPARLSTMPTRPANTHSVTICSTSAVDSPASRARRTNAPSTAPRSSTRARDRAYTAASVGSAGSSPPRMAAMSPSPAPSAASTVEWKAAP